MNNDQQENSVKPSEQRGGTTPGDREASAKGPWAAKAAEGIVPADLGGSDAPPDMLGEEPELGDPVLGATTGSDQPATETGVDLDAGENADATADGGPDRTAAPEPDLKDAAAGPRQVDLDSGDSA
jgi:hypothetical protein